MEDLLKNSQPTNSERVIYPKSLYTVKTKIEEGDVIRRRQKEEDANKKMTIDQEINRLRIPKRKKTKWDAFKEQVFKKDHIFELGHGHKPLIGEARYIALKRAERKARAVLGLAEPKESVQCLSNEEKHRREKGEHVFKIEINYNIWEEVLVSISNESLAKKRKKRRKKKSKKNLVQKKKLTEYEKWCQSPHDYRRAKQAKAECEMLKKQERYLEIKSHVNTDFLELQEFSFLQPIDPILTPEYCKQFNKMKRKKAKLADKLGKLLLIFDFHNPCHYEKLNRITEELESSPLCNIPFDKSDAKKYKNNSAKEENSDKKTRRVKSQDIMNLINQSKGGVPADLIFDIKYGDKKEDFLKSCSNKSAAKGQNVSQRSEIESKRSRKTDTAGKKQYDLSCSKFKNEKKKRSFKKQTGRGKKIKICYDLETDWDEFLNEVWTSPILRKKFTQKFRDERPRQKFITDYVPSECSCASATYLKPENSDNLFLQSSRKSRVSNKSKFGPDLEKFFSGCPDAPCQSICDQKPKKKRKITRKQQRRQAKSAPHRDQFCGRSSKRKRKKGGKMMCRLQNGNKKAARKRKRSHKKYCSCAKKKNAETYPGIPEVLDPLEKYDRYIFGKKKRRKMQSETQKRQAMTHEEYVNYLAQPQRKLVPPKQKKKKRGADPTAQDYYDRLAQPSQRFVIETINLYKNVLPGENLESLCKRLCPLGPVAGGQKKPASDFKQLDNIFKKRQITLRKLEMKYYRLYWRHFQDALDREIDTLTEIFLTVLTRGSPKDITLKTLLGYYKFFAIANSNGYKLCRPKRTSRTLRSMLRKNAADVISSWARCNYKEAERRAMLQNAWLVPKFHKRTRKVQLAEESEESTVSIGYYEEEEGGKTASAKGLMDEKLETIVDIMIRILVSGDMADLEKVISFHLLGKNTYKDLLAILKRLQEANVLLEQKPGEPDLIDLEAEECLNTWVNNYRKSIISGREQTAINIFSRHLLDLFDIPKDGILQESEMEVIYPEEEGRRDSLYKVVADDKFKPPSLSEAEITSESGLYGPGAESVPTDEEDKSRFGADYGEGLEPGAKGEDKLMAELEDEIKREGFLQQQEDFLQQQEGFPQQQEGYDEELEGVEGTEWGEIPPEGEVSLKEMASLDEQLNAGLGPLGHPSKVLEHTEGTICCVSVKKYAEWLQLQAAFLDCLSTRYKQTLKILKVLSEYKKLFGVQKGDQEKLAEVENKFGKLIKILEDYRRYVKDTNETMYEEFLGKQVICCKLCLLEEAIPDGEDYHKVLQQLTDATQKLQEEGAALKKDLDVVDDMLSKVENELKDAAASKPSGSGQSKKDEKKPEYEEDDVLTLYEFLEITPGDVTSNFSFRQL